MRARRATTAVGVLGAVLLMCMASSWACTAQPTLEPPTPAIGLAGTSVLISGSQWSAARPDTSQATTAGVEVRWGSTTGPVLATATGDTWSANFTVPDVAHGYYAVVATAVDSNGAMLTSDAQTFFVGTADEAAAMTPAPQPVTTPAAQAVATPAPTPVADAAAPQVASAPAPATTPSVAAPARAVAPRPVAPAPSAAALAQAGVRPGSAIDPAVPLAPVPVAGAVDAGQSRSTAAPATATVRPSLVAAPTGHSASGSPLGAGAGMVAIGLPALAGGALLVAVRRRRVAATARS
ncbi:MAG TPA: hypothetical protein VFJ85_00760 [Acidimicrobiales bacterium]|nr:hypothetical protein [Acidimicrobiales bacterium]